MLPEHGKSLRKQANSIGIGLLFYVGLSYAIMEATLHMPDCIAHNDGVACLMAYGFSGVALYFYARHFGEPAAEGEAAKICKAGVHMTLLAFLGIACVIQAIQVMSYGLDYLLELLVNPFGFTAEDSAEEAAESGDGIAMFIYTGIGAPVIEELIYRGYVLRRLQRYGNLFAIMVSAAAFGLMHENIPQAMFAFMIGITLGYVAVVYSVKWAIVFHILNNLVMGDLLYRITDVLDTETQNIILNSLDVVGCIGAIIALAVGRRAIASFIRKGHACEGVYRNMLPAFWLMLFLVIELAVGISKITPL
ncbi:MAG: CPBP family intramembrane glutamic endopeptidase [Lentihominibacter sp.]